MARSSLYDIHQEIEVLTASLEDDDFTPERTSWAWRRQSWIRMTTEELGSFSASTLAPIPRK
eukprot:2152142-Pyramimonas_sp.AAC.1